jgi:DNA-binding NarL/FixJ family response regulator
MKKLKILLVDDHQIMLDGIRALLEGDDQFQIAGEATRCSIALEMIPKIKPDIIITDISLPEMNGIEFTRLLKKDAPDIKVLALSMSGEEGMISEMIDAGIAGYVLKNTGKQELKEALTKISNGEMFFSAEVAAEMMRAIHRKKQIKENAEKAHLTLREKEIIRLIAKEYSNAKIADELFISERTVETHRKNIFRKTNTKSVVGLLKYAMENDLV